MLPVAAAADPRHRHDRRLRVLDPGHGRRRAGAARRGHAGVPREGARAARAHELAHDVPRATRSSCAPTSTATRRRCSACRSRTSTARSRRSSARSPSSQFNQFSRVVVGDPAVGRARTARIPDDLTRLYTRSSNGPDGAALGAGDDAVGRRPRPAAALQRLSGGEDQRQRRARLQLGRRDRGDGGRREAKCCRRATRSRGRASRSRRRSRAARR